MPQEQVHRGHASQRLTVTVEEAAVVLGISRTLAYESVRRGELPVIRIGRRILVPAVALDELLRAHTREQL